jgi:hypothetical protein
VSAYTGSCFCCPATWCEQAGWDGMVPQDWEEWCLAYDECAGCSGDRCFDCTEGDAC